MKPRLVFAIFGLALTVALPAPAHHSFAAEYDANAPLAVTGVVTKVEWTNPHIYYYVDVKDEAGNVTNWAFEGYPPNTLKRTGVTRDLFVPGETVTVTGWKARDGSKRAASREITFRDGRKMFTGPPAN
jgi:DNA/RNA endonuclease YhcR with UshA esterase domain